MRVREGPQGPGKLGDDVTGQVLDLFRLIHRDDAGTLSAPGDLVGYLGRGSDHIDMPAPVPEPWDDAGEKER